MTVKWYGDKLQAEIDKAVGPALFEVGEELVKTAADKAPKESGDLVASAYVSGAGRSTYRSKRIHNQEVEGDERTVMAGFAAFYAGFVEYGTRHLSARPFLRPAFDEMKERISQMIADGIKRKVGR